MNILFRVDAGGKIGLGHYYRSMHLAKKLVSRGHKIYFTHQSSDFWASLQCEFKHVEASSEDEQLQLIERYQIKLFYVDGILDFSETFIETINSKYCCKIMFYQNISSSRHLCDSYILPSLHQQPNFFSSFSNKTKIYQGLEYFTFNEKLSTVTPKTEVVKNVKNIAIVSGGSDPKNLLRMLFSMLKIGKIDNINYTYFYGTNYLYKESLPTNEKNHQFKPFDIQNIINNDLVITTFGVSAYEFMALKIPVIGIGHQPTNAYACDYLAQEGYLFSLGNADNLNQTYFYETIQNIINDFESRKNKVAKASEKIDLQGVTRIIKIIENE